jgi:hypothetical protein
LVPQQKKMVKLDCLVVDRGKNCVTHYAVNAVFTALLCLVHFAYCNYFAIYGFESPVKFSIYSVSYLKHCSHRYT